MNIQKLTLLATLTLGLINISHVNAMQDTSVNQDQALLQAITAGDDLRSFALVYNGAMLQESTILNFSNTNITDFGLRCIGTISSLEKLFLSNTQVTGVGLENPECKKTLTHLILSKTKITEETLHLLGQLPNLEYLHLSNNPQLTDTGVAVLGTLKKLKCLYLFKTGITQPGMAALQAQLPKTKIYWSAAA